MPSEADKKLADDIIAGRQGSGPSLRNRIAEALSTQREADARIAEEHECKRSVENRLCLSEIAAAIRGK